MLIPGPPARTYCTAYHRLAGGDEIFCDELDYAYPEEEYPCAEEDSPTLTRDSFLPPANTLKPPEKAPEDLLTPDSGTYSQTNSPAKVSKSLSLQFPRAIKLTFSRSLNFCVFQPSGLASSGVKTSSSSDMDTPQDMEEEEEYDWGELQFSIQ